MSAMEPDTPFQRECKDSTLRKTRAMRQLTDAFGGQGGVSFVSLIPITKIINSVVSRRHSDYKLAVHELKALIDRKKERMALSDLPMMAEINFLEAFNSYIAYTHVGSRNAIDVMPKSKSPIKDKTALSRDNSPKKRAPKRMQDSKENDDLPNKSARRSPSVIVVDDEEEENQEEQEEEEKDKNKKQSKSLGAEAKMGLARDEREKPKNSLSMNVSMNASLRTLLIECGVKDCHYSSANLENIYSHVKQAHPDFLTTFKCLDCGETRACGAAIKKHITLVCTDAKVELTLEPKPASMLATPKPLPPRLKTAKEEAINKSPNTTQSTAVLANKVDVAFTICPMPACGFSGWTAENVATHFEKNHSESALSYKCSGCAYSNKCFQSVMTHCNSSCPDKQPEMLVDGELVKRTRRTPAAAPTPTVRVPKRPQLSQSMRKRPTFMSPPKRRRMKKDASLEDRLKEIDRYCNERKKRGSGINDPIYEREADEEKQSLKKEWEMKAKAKEDKKKKKEMRAKAKEDKKKQKEMKAKAKEDKKKKEMDDDEEDEEEEDMVEDEDKEEAANDHHMAADESDEWYSGDSSAN